ncbi:MAG: hypothetical protein J1G06_01560 [Oscillospiraceae bacterium]|nr:hypothetical protein [Oscillospiraceae bacterium]
MKKLISLITVFILMSVTAFASDADDLAAMFDKSGELRSASVELTLKTDINKPLDIISQIPNSESEYSTINPQMMVESLIGTEMKLNCTYSVSEDYNKMLAEVYMEFDAPIQLNENLRISAWTKIGTWVEYDLTDKKNPVYRVIRKSPTGKKYDVIDMSGYFKENPDDLPAINADVIKEQQKKAKDALLNNAEITKADGVYTIRLTDETAKNYIKDVMSMAKEFMPGDTETDSIMSQLLGFFERVNIFGKDGITITVTPNKAGYIDAETTDMHINMNVYDAITEFGGSTKGLDRDKAEIDLTVKAACKYTNHNSAKPVLPEITDENSNVIEYGDDDYSYNDIVPALGRAYRGEKPVILDNIAYFPYEDMAGQIGMDLKTEVKEDTIVVSIGESYHVDVKGNEVTLYGDTEDRGLTPVISENGQWYCSRDFLWDLGMHSSDLWYDTESNSIKYTFWYDGLPEDWSTDIDTDTDYEEYNPYKDRTYYYVYSDRALYLANDTAYVPIYDLLYEISPGEYTFRENGFEYTAEWENSLGINTVSVYTGDKFVTVNGEQKELPYEAVDIDGVIRVPVAFADKIGLETNSISFNAYGAYSYFGFHRRPVNETGSDAYKYSYNDYDNWFYSLMHSF